MRKIQKISVKSIVKSIMKASDEKAQLREKPGL